MQSSLIYLIVLSLPIISCTTNNPKENHKPNSTVSTGDIRQKVDATNAQIDPHAAASFTDTIYGPEDGRKYSYRSIYINQFKLTYFRRILIKSYNNSKAIREIISTDHSGFTEPILMVSDYEFIDSLTNIDNQKMIRDSAEAYQPGYQRAEGSQGKRSLDYILHKIRGTWLDSLAEERFKLSGLP